MGVEKHEHRFIHGVKYCSDNTYLEGVLYAVEQAFKCFTTYYVLILGKQTFKLLHKWLTK